MLTSGCALPQPKGEPFASVIHWPGLLRVRLATAGDPGPTGSWRSRSARTRPRGNSGCWTTSTSTAAWRSVPTPPGMVRPTDADHRGPPGAARPPLRDLGRERAPGSRRLRPGSPALRGSARRGIGQPPPRRPLTTGLRPVWLHPAGSQTQEWPLRGSQRPDKSGPRPLGSRFRRLRPTQIQEHRWPLPPWGRGAQRTHRTEALLVWVSTPPPSTASNPARPRPPPASRGRTPEVSPGCSLRGLQNIEARCSPPDLGAADGHGRDSPMT